MDNGKLMDIGGILRALGIIEGVACTLDNAEASALTEAVRMIDEAVKGVFEKYG